MYLHGRIFLCTSVSSVMIVQVHRLGEACLHIIASASCMTNASEVCQQTGADSFTSSLCGWSHSASDCVTVQ